MLEEWVPLSREDLCPPVQKYRDVELDEDDTVTEGEHDEEQVSKRNVLDAKVGFLAL